MRVQTEAATVEYGGRFSFLNPGDGPQDLDLVFAVVAHGVAHEWWGMQVAPVDVEERGFGPPTRSLLRKGPFALYAMREYIGKERIDDALRRLFEKYRSGTPPLPTSRNLYQELQAITPAQFQSLLRDLFEKNTFLATRGGASHREADRSRRLAGDTRRAVAQG